MSTSEFGKGYAYCLGLFLAHAEREDYSVSHLWFNGAADHLYEFKARTKEEINFKDKCLTWRIEKYTQEDKEWAIDKAKKLLLNYDKKNGYEAIEGTWE